jgi:16S rRNA (adenine1518-N6/adenine1519-N6)-dimethyltransferase
MAVLGEVLAGTSVRLIEGDAMHVSWEEVLGVGPWALVANLPYNVATPLVADLLDGVPAITKMVVMVQREVAERLAARPGDTAYGAVSVKVAYWATAAIVAKVPATVFLPKPNVESAIVRIDRRGEPAVDPALQADLFALVRAGFAKRRKMLRGSLGAMVTAEQFAAAGVRPDQRAEELGVADWGRLAAAVQAAR